MFKFVLDKPIHTAHLILCQAIKTTNPKNGASHDDRRKETEDFGMSKEKVELYRRYIEQK